MRSKNERDQHQPSSGAASALPPRGAGRGTRHRAPRRGRPSRAPRTGAPRRRRTRARTHPRTPGSTPLPWRAACHVPAHVRVPVDRVFLVVDLAVEHRHGRLHRVHPGQLLGECLERLVLVAALDHVEVEHGRCRSATCPWRTPRPTGGTRSGACRCRSRGCPPPARPTPRECCRPRGLRDPRRARTARPCPAYRSPRNSAVVVGVAGVQDLRAAADHRAPRHPDRHEHPLGVRIVDHVVDVVPVVVVRAVHHCRPGRVLVDQREVARQASARPGRPSRPAPPSGSP